MISLSPNSLPHPYHYFTLRQAVPPPEILIALLTPIGFYYVTKTKKKNSEKGNKD
jgi:hypothetical protein